jgi:hypothetical protein
MTNKLKKGELIKNVCDERVSAPISTGGISDLRKLILRTLNDNQLLVLSSISKEKRTITSTLKRLSKTYGVPLSTLKLNARILRELNLISYGSIKKKQAARLEPLGSFVLRLIKDEPRKAIINFDD